MTDFAFIKEITPAAVGIWSLLAMVAVALIKAWPVLALQAQAAREKLRGEHRRDLSDCQERLDRMQKELNDTNEKVHQIEINLFGAISAYKVLDTEVEERWPNSAALKQARSIMSTAFAMGPSTNPKPYEGFELHVIKNEGDGNGI